MRPESGPRCSLGGVKVSAFLWVNQKQLFPKPSRAWLPSDVLMERKSPRGSSWCRIIRGLILSSESDANQELLPCCGVKQHEKPTGPAFTRPKAIELGPYLPLRWRSVISLQPFAQKAAESSSCPCFLQQDNGLL